MKSSDTTGADERLEQASTELATLRRFSGPAKEFWPRFLAACGALAQADVAAIVLAREGQNPRWKKIGEWTAGSGKPSQRANFAAFLETSAEQVVTQGNFVEEDDESEGAFGIGVRLKSASEQDALVLVAEVVDFNEAAAREAFNRLTLAADTPALYQAHLASRQAQADVEKFATVLDLLVPVNAETRFLASLLALVNGVATRFRCARVSVGWIEGGYVRLKAISRTEKFDRQMAAAQALEAAMEECADQDEEVLWPIPEGATAVSRDHEKFVTDHQAGAIASVPIRIDDRVVAVLTCERAPEPFTAVEMQQLRLLCDQVSRRLVEVKRHDRWLGARLLGELREASAKLVGPEHTWPKVIGLLVALLVIALFVVRLPYRVQGTFILRSDAVSYLTAPFDGYIDEVNARPGDVLAKGAPIVSLNRAELLLEQSAAAAEIGRYQREAEKARALNQLAEMKIAEALMRQSESRFELVKYRLGASVMKAAFDGVIVEGDLRERIGAPVKSGEALFKVARLDGLFVEAEVDERDVREILKSSRAEFSFVAQPKLRFSATVQSIEPAALAKKDNNVFLVRLKPDAAPDNWWRPGMTGLCKISVESRTIWWIVTHRTMDFLRLKLWW
ncbi:MAG: HlyD family efflux transporter periplasmic adaptor subunit [Chthoniobacteraceae bacterium]